MTRELLARIARLAAAATLGLGIAVLDRGQEEVQPAAFLLLVSGFAFSALKPREAWAYALPLGSGIPVLTLVSQAQGAPWPWPSAPGSTWIALVPAAIGALVGAAVGSGLRAARKPTPPV
jgi:hypothetical protein